MSAGEVEIGGSGGPKAVLFASDLPEAAVAAIDRALRQSGCAEVDVIADLDGAVAFDCGREGCPREVDPRLQGASLVVIDETVSGVSGFEALGVMRGLPETSRARTIMFGPHGPHDHRSVLAAWGLGVDCYLTRQDYLDDPEGQVEKLARFAGALLGEGK